MFYVFDEVVDELGHLEFVYLVKIVEQGVTVFLSPQIQQVDCLLHDLVEILTILRKAAILEALDDAYFFSHFGIVLLMMSDQGLNLGRVVFKVAEIEGEGQGLLLQAVRERLKGNFAQLTLKEHLHLAGSEEQIDFPVK